MNSDPRQSIEQVTAIASTPTDRLTDATRVATLVLAASRHQLKARRPKRYDKGLALVKRRVLELVFVLAPVERLIGSHEFNAVKTAVKALDDAIDESWAPALERSSVARAGRAPKRAASDRVASKMIREILRTNPRKSARAIHQRLRERGLVIGIHRVRRLRDAP